MGNIGRAEVDPAWFKWEFLRRNERYKKDYADFEKRFDQWFRDNGYWWARTGPAYDRETWFFFCSVIAPEAKRICLRWGISEPYDPAWIFETNGTGSQNGTVVALPFFFNDAQEAKIWDLDALDPKLYSADEELRAMLRNVPDTIEPENWRVTTDRHVIRVEIDITKPVEHSLAEIKRKIDLGRRKFESTFGPLPDHRRRPRSRVDQYETYLRIWDLRTKERLSFERIARAVFPIEMKGADGSSPTVKRVRSQFERACELIAGDYRQIEG